MSKTPNAPSTPPDPTYYDKYETAAKCGISVSTLFYHNYVSHAIAPGTRRYGRLFWTQTQISDFLTHRPTPGRKADADDSTVTVAAYLSDGQHVAVNNGLAAYYKNKLVHHVERDLTHTRRYYLHLEDGEIIPTWNNTRLALRPTPNDSESNWGDLPGGDQSDQKPPPDPKPHDSSDFKD